jgi:hypothetical protein
MDRLIYLMRHLLREERKEASDVEATQVTYRIVASRPAHVSTNLFERNTAEYSGILSHKPRQLSF